MTPTQNQAWPNLELQNIRRQLESVAQLVKSPPRKQSDEVTNSLARFLVIRCAGYLEAVAEECCKEYIKTKAAPTVASFANSSFARGRNPSPRNMLELAQRFSKAWEEELCSLLDDEDERLRRELDLLVSKRNSIAHGRSDSVGARKALDLVESVVLVADWFIHTLDPR